MPIGCRNPPKFKVGDRIRVLNIRPEGHTRLPRYIRDKVGVIKRDHGVYPFPDTAIAGDMKPQHVYSVQFDAREVWGVRAPATDSLRIDLWDDYMIPFEQLFAWLRSRNERLNKVSGVKDTNDT